MAICVTGGSSGLGRAIAERFSRPGNDVFINYHANDAAAADAAEAVRTAGGNAHLVKVDLTQPEGAAELMAQISARVDRLDQLVHAAAKTVPGPLLEVNPADFVDSLALNASALVHLVREALPLLGEGSCVFYLTSRGGRTVLPGYGSLGVAKALADHIVRYLAVELAPRGVRVNCISPGPVDTPAYRAMFPDTWKERLASAVGATPAGRGVGAAEVAAAVELLTQQEFSMVVGQTITIDGGFSL